MNGAVMAHCEQCIFYHPKRHWHKAALFTLFIMIILSCAAAPVIKHGYDMYIAAISAKPISQAVSEIRSKDHYTALDTLPPIYKDAVLSVEDRRFYYHIGVDPISICRAVIRDAAARSFVEGGSTITQQVAKNLYFTQEKRFSRKVAEIFVAFDLERAYSKDEILELYINSIYYGSGYYGIYDASEGYFGKTPSEMSDAECTLLAGLPNAPSAYSPDASPKLAKERQSQVVAAMVRNRKLSQEQANGILLSQL
jgi:monofunctional glycosyltransferase